MLESVYVRMFYCSVNSVIEQCNVKVSMGILKNEQYD